MSLELTNAVVEALPHIDGYVYPNEQMFLWGGLIVVYPYVTGLVAGAFIMASLVRVFKVHALEPAYRLALLISLAFLSCATLPLLFHLGQPQRCYEIMITPHFSSPMAMFGFVYAWYMMAVLLLELWLEYRRSFVLWSRQFRGVRGLLYRILTIGVYDTSERALHVDDRLSKIITIVGIPSAFLLHGYVGFIFGSIKANPWWGNVLMPIIFIFSAIVSGIALCVVIYMALCRIRGRRIDMPCLDKMGMFLFYALVFDAALEGLDWIHRLYEAEESIAVLKSLATGKLFNTLLILQGLLGTLVPFVLLFAMQLFKKHVPETARKLIYLSSGLLILLGVLAMRWNVVIGGQLFSKSLRGFTTYKMEAAGAEGWLMSVCLMILPFFVLWVLLRIFFPPPAEERPPGGSLPQSKPA